MGEKFKILFRGFVMPFVEVTFEEAQEWVDAGATFDWIRNECYIWVDENLHKGSSRRLSERK